ncbi:hypothetical protein TNCV_4031881 [Trichonephila clavipes]|nr:hypothetical protein TNCV_4031881 [Trichonephila clavipes]
MGPVQCSGNDITGDGSRNSELQFSNKDDTRARIYMLPANYMSAFDDGPRNLEPWSSDEATHELAPPLLTTTPHPREDV